MKLEQYKKPINRFDDGNGLIIFSLSKKEEEEIKKMIIDSQKEITDDKVEMVSLFDIVRYIIKNCSSIGDDVDNYNDVELDALFDDCTHSLKMFKMEIEKIIEELLDETLKEMEHQYKEVLRLLQSAKQKTDLEGVEAQLKNEINGILDGIGINLQIEEMIGKNEDEVKKIIASKTENK